MALQAMSETTILASFQRRCLETLGIFAWMLSGPGIYMLTFLIVPYVLFNPSMWWIALLYAIWVVYMDRKHREKGSFGLESYRSAAVWRYARDYFPVTLKRTAELDSKQNYLMCAYPHAIMPPGIMLAFATDALETSKVFPGMKPRLVALSLNFSLPIVRDVAKAAGLVSSSEEDISEILRDPNGGNMVTLVVGGAAESMHTRPDCYHIILKKRTGFCRIALREGVPLVPVFSFGENRTFDHVRLPWLQRFQELVRKYTGVAPLMPFGRGLLQPYFGFMPHRVPITVVVGEPIPVKRVPCPTMEEILSLRQKFEDALVQLYEKHRPIYHPNEDIPLIIE